MPSWELAEVMGFISHNENSKTAVRVAVSKLGKRAYGDLRMCWKDNDGEWKPTRKGLSLDYRSLVCLRESIDHVLAAMDIRYGGIVGYLEDDCS